LKNFPKVIPADMPDVGLRHIQADARRKPSRGADRQPVTAGAAAAMDNLDFFPKPAHNRMIFGPGDVGLDEPMLRKSREVIEYRDEEREEVFVLAEGPACAPGVDGAMDGDGRPTFLTGQVQEPGNPWQGLGRKANGYGGVETEFHEEPEILEDGREIRP